jgi:hypothetical protein
VSYRLNINHDFGELILKVQDGATRNALLALAVHFGLLAEPVPTEAEVEQAANVRALRRTVTADEVVH